MSDTLDIDFANPDSPADLAEGRRTLTESDAVEIWIGRWLRVRCKDLAARHGCDPRQLYAIWWGDRFPGSREKAEQTFRRRHPGLADRVGFGYRRIPRRPAMPVGEQPSLFGW